MDLVRDGSSARTAIADPMGTAFAPGPDHYEQTVRAIAAAYALCLGGKSGLAQRRARRRPKFLDVAKKWCRIMGLTSQDPVKASR
jgi:hypothetical protein